MDFDIIKLAELLNPKRFEESDSDEDKEKDDNTSEEPSPADVADNKQQKKSNAYAKLEVEERKILDVSDPADEEALYFTEDSAGASDWRKTPEWDVSYKQQVTSSDVFLQMSGKSPSTASCEDMILKIHLPEEDHRNIDLKITKQQIKLISPKFRLEVPLPHPVDPKCGNAQWNKDTEQLLVTLRMEREFDFVNF